jgi:hypothetical protein
LEREVSAEELLKIQSKPPSRTDSSAIQENAPSPGPAADSSYAPSIGPRVATPGVTTPGVSAAAPGAVTPEAAVPPSAPEPIYGAPASATTPAAMHAADQYVADPKSTHE